jgi:hypothetical protein
MNLDKISVAINGESVTYVIAETQAPKEYDGFGTFSLYEYYDDEDQSNNYRIVLIRLEHLAWQEGRYASGMFAAQLPSWLDPKNVVNELWVRLTRQGEEVAK